MALADAEIEWVEWIAGKKIDAAKVQKNEKRNEDKTKFLADVMNAQLTQVRDEIDEAQNIVVTRTKDPTILVAAWRKLSKSDKEDTSDMKWRATDEDTNLGILDDYELRADVEIDTVADIDEKTKLIEMSDLAALEQSFQRIKQMEKAMRMQFDDEGQPLFTDEDIRNELYTPLVRSGLIPDNMVPDKFSEHAVAFKGAQDMYSKKIEAFTATTSKTEQNLKRGLRIAKDAVVMTGALVSGSLTIANSDDIANLNKQISEAKKLGQDTTALSNKVTDLENMAKFADTGTALLTGGISFVELGVEHAYTAKTKDSWAKWMTTISKGFEIAQGMAVKSVELGIKANSADGGNSEKGLITCVTCAMNAGFTGAKMVPNFVLIIQETDDAKRATMIAGLMADLGSVVSDSIIAATANVKTPIPKDATDQQKKDIKQADADAAASFKQIAAYCKIAITQAGNGPAIIRAYQAGDTKTLGLLLGGGAIAATFAGTTELIYDSVREDVTKAEMLNRTFENSAYAEETGVKQEAGQDSGSADSIEKINKEIATIDKSLFKGLKPGFLNSMSDVSKEKLQEQLDGDIAKKQKELAEKRMEEALSPEAMEEIMNDVDAKLVGFEKIYSDAFPDPNVLKRTPEEIIQANFAIDRAMQNTSELRMKVTLINGMVGGAAGVLAALVPGTGAVVAATKLAADIYALVKCVETHNTWCDSMAVAMAGQGGVTAAIENTLHNAKIQLSKAAITAVLSALKMSAEVAKVFDPSGAAAATSAGASMASAVVEFSYKMHKESEIDKGWKAYVAARAQPGNRKAARKALRLNSTLAKCCIAYGAAIMGDIGAKQAVKASGLSIAALKSDKDICVRLVAYLENELVDDPVVMKVDYQKGTKWMPGTPALSLVSWTSFKAAAVKTAVPALSDASLSTPGIDRLLSSLAANDYPPIFKRLEKARTTKATDPNALPDDQILEDPQKLAQHKAILDQLNAANDALIRLNQVLLAYQPLAESGSGPHSGMADAAKTFATLARAEQKTVDANIKVLKAYPEQVV